MAYCDPAARNFALTVRWCQELQGQPGQGATPGSYVPEVCRLWATPIDMVEWLRILGLERYEAAFRENDVDTEVLPDLTADDLIGLGVTSIGHRRKLLAAIAASISRNSFMRPTSTIRDAKLFSSSPASGGHLLP